MIGYWRWLYSSTPADLNDALQIRISANGGASWTSVETIHGNHAHWEEAAIRVANFVTPGPDVRVQFIASDRGDASVVEAAIDDLVLYENGSTVTLAPSASHLALRAPWPNPSRGDMRLSFALHAPGEVDVAVLDVQGRTVRVLAHGALRSGWHELSWDGRDAAGREAPAGLYFARVRSGGEEMRARLVRVR